MILALGGAGCGAPLTATFEPALEEVTGPTGGIERPVTVRLSSGATAELAPPVRVVEVRSTRDRVALELVSDQVVLELLDRSGLRCRVPLGAPDRAELSVVAGDRFLATWGAGAGVAVAQLVDPDCRILATVDAPVLEVSPDRRWLLGYPGVGTPRAGDHRVRRVELRGGAEIVVTRLDEGHQVTGVQWEGDRAVLTTSRGERIVVP